MNLMFRAALVAGLALAAFLSLVPPAQACKCMFPSPQDAKANATAVFEGRVDKLSGLRDRSGRHSPGSAGTTR